MKSFKLCAFIFLFSASVFGQTVESMSFSELEKKVNALSGIVILNYWATWCRPCVAELPDFEKLAEEYRNKDVRVMLINLDFNSKVDSTVIPFVQSRKLKSQVIHITDTDPNGWINKVDSSWSGAIPATVIYKNNKKVFFIEGQMTYEALKEQLSKF
jgi:thiol-disulfide isomerase/thioredoxin